MNGITFRDRASGEAGDDDARRPEDRQPHVDAHAEQLADVALAKGRMRRTNSVVQAERGEHEKAGDDSFAESWLREKFMGCTLPNGSVPVKSICHMHIQLTSLMKHNSLFYSH